MFECSNVQPPAPPTPKGETHAPCLSVRALSLTKHSLSGLKPKGETCPLFLSPRGRASSACGRQASGIEGVCGPFSSSPRPQPLKGGQPAFSVYAHPSFLCVGGWLSSAYGRQASGIKRVRRPFGREFPIREAPSPFLSIRDSNVRMFYCSNVPLFSQRLRTACWFR